MEGDAGAVGAASVADAELDVLDVAGTHGISAYWEAAAVEQLDVVASDQQKVDAETHDVDEQNYTDSLYTAYQLLKTPLVFE